VEDAEGVPGHGDARLGGHGPEPADLGGDDGVHLGRLHPALDAQHRTVGLEGGADGVGRHGGLLTQVVPYSGEHGLDGLGPAIQVGDRPLDQGQRGAPVGVHDRVDLLQREIGRPQQADQPAGRHLVGRVVAVPVQRVHPTRRQQATLGVDPQRLGRQQGQRAEPTGGHQLAVVVRGHVLTLSVAPGARSTPIDDGVNSADG
jgi:hypothetical protein